MKKFFHKLTAIVAVLIMCLSFAGCSLFEQSGGGSFNGQGLPDSSVSAQSIVFKTQNETERKVLSRSQAVSLVERSVVAIQMDKEGSTSYGAGVIVDLEDSINKEFYILTAHHVIADGGNVTVYVPDDRTRNFTDDDYNKDFTFKGVIDNVIHEGNAITLVGGDAESDIAVLKLNLNGTGITEDKIIPASLPASGYSLTRGEDVFAIGNPSGKLPMTVSAGIVSYLDREVYIGEVGYMNLTQIDVQINHGNSGGGLFNMYGELVGITNSGSEVYDGINYSIPFKTSYAENDTGFINIASQLIGTKTESNYGYVSGRWQLGITTQQKTRYNDGSTYVELTSIVKDSNVEKSNDANPNKAIKVGDIITKISFNDGEEDVEIKVSSISELSSAVYKMKKYLKLGDSLKITVDRQSGYRVESIESTITLSVQNIFCNTGNAVVVE